MSETVKVEVGKTGDIVVSLLERIKKLEKALAGVECSVCNGKGVEILAENNSAMVGRNCIPCGGTGKVVRPLED